MHNNETCLDYYWKLLKGVSPDKYGKSVYNLINTHRMARKGNLSGMKFDGIDFGNVPLNDLHFDNGEKSAQFIDCKFQELNFMTGHTENITHAVFSGDGRFVLSMDEANTFIWWETESGLQRGKCTLPEEMLESDDEIMGIGFSEQNEKTPEPLGLMAYTKYGVCFSRTLALSEEETWEKRSLLTVDDCEVIVYSPDYTHALIRKRHTDAYLDEVIEKMAADPEHKPVEQVYWVYDICAGKMVREIENAVGKLVRSDNGWELLVSYEKAAFSRDNQCLAMRGCENVIRIWQFKKGDLTEIQAEGVVNAVSLSENGEICAFCCWKHLDAIACIWIRQEGIMIPLSEPLLLHYHCRIVVSDDAGCALMISDCDAVLYRFRDNADKVVLEDYGAVSKCFEKHVVHIVNPYCLTAAGNTITIWNVKTGEKKRTLGGNTGKFKAVFSSNRKFAVLMEEGASLSDRDSIMFKEYDVSAKRQILWNIELGRCVTTLDRKSDALSFSPDGSTLIMTDGNRFFNYISLNGHLQGEADITDPEILGLNWECRRIFWGNSNRYCIITDGFGRIFVWDILKDKLFAIDAENVFSVTSAVLSSNHHYLVYTTQKDEILLFNIRTGEQRSISPDIHKYGFNYYKVSDIADDGKEVLLVSELTKQASWWSTGTSPVLLRKATISDDIRNYLFPPENKYPAESINGEYRIPAQDGEPEKVLYLIPNLYIKGCRFVNTGDSHKIDPDSKVGKILYQYGGELITKGEDKT